MGSMRLRCSSSSSSGQRAAISVAPNTPLYNNCLGLGLGGHPGSHRLSGRLRTEFNALAVSDYSRPITAEQSHISVSTRPDMCSGTIYYSTRVTSQALS